MHKFIYNGISSADFNLVLSGEGTWDKPAPEVTHTKIPGRSGDLLEFNDRYENVEVRYNAGIKRGFSENYTAFLNHLLKSPGYHRLEDSWHPGYFRLAVFEKKTVPELSALLRSGTFELVFSCKPQMYLISGEETVRITGSGEITDPTLFASRPLIRVYGTGTVSIGSRSFQVTKNTDYTDIDSETEDCFCGAENRNGNVEFTAGEFPVLTPGRNRITLGAGISKIEITPRWWQL